MNRSQPNQRFWILVLALLPGACAVVEIPNGFVPEPLTLGREGGQLVLVAKFAVKPGEEVKTALLAGVPLRINFDTGVRIKDAWPWQAPLLERRLVMELRYSALSEQYVIHRSDNDSQRFFTNLERMMAAVGAPPEHRFMVDGLENGYEYRFHARMYLDLPGLPPPLRLPAYFSQDWRMDSGYQYLTLRN